MRASMRGGKNSNLTMSNSASIRLRPFLYANRTPFDAEMCAVVEELKPEVVSFHYGLPEQALVTR